MEIIQQYLKDDIELVRGGDWHETILFYEDDGVTPKDVTDWDMEFVIQKSPNGLVFDLLSVANGRIIPTPLNGQFNLSLSAAEVDGYDFTSAVYRMRVDYGDGNIQVFRLGNVRVV